MQSLLGPKKLAQRWALKKGVIFANIFIRE
jgi:hypothetical protein